MKTRPRGRGKRSSVNWQGVVETEPARTGTARYRGSKSVQRRQTKESESAETPNHGEESSFRRAARKISRPHTAVRGEGGDCHCRALCSFEPDDRTATDRGGNRGDFIADKIPRRFNETTKRSSDTRHPSFPRRVCRQIRRHRARQGDRSSGRAHAVRRAFTPPALQGRGR